MWRGPAGHRPVTWSCSVDADVLDPAPHYVVGLVGPLLLDAGVHLVKGFYRRPLVAADGQVTEYGGRVTELVARPLLSLYRPDLARLVQPLAGEWAGRRQLLESLPFPTGYGVEIAVLLDAYAAVGSAGMAQVDLGHAHPPAASHGRPSASWPPRSWGRRCAASVSSPPAT